MNKVYPDSQVVRDRDMYVLHYRNGFTGSFKQLFDNREDLNKEVCYLVAQDFEYSGRKEFNQWKSFYVTHNDRLVTPRKGKCVYSQDTPPH